MKLTKGYEFIIDRDNKYNYIEFKHLDGSEFKDYENKLTKGQWQRAKKYLNRELIAFQGYEYSFKNEFTKPIKII